jgi:hypothetical protein
MNDADFHSRHLSPVEKYEGCCEMETDTWACGTTDTLTGTNVRPNPDGDHTEFRYVCSSCAVEYAE